MDGEEVEIGISVWMHFVFDEKKKHNYSFEVIEYWKYSLVYQWG